MFCRPFFGFLFAAILATGVERAVAAIVVFNFQGVVTEVPLELAPEFGIGETIMGSYAFESTSTPNQDGNFLGAVVSFEGSIGDYRFASDGAGDIGLEGGYFVSSFTQAANVGTAAPFLHSIQLLGGSLPAGVLPLDPPDLNQFSQRLFTLDFLDGANLPRLVGRIDSISIVPEPSGFAVCLSLLATQVLRRSTRRRMKVQHSFGLKA